MSPLPHLKAAGCVQGIGALITEMVAGVAGGRNRTFAPEIAVFYDMWWKDANSTQRETVRRLVRSGWVQWTAFAGTHRRVGMSLAWDGGGSRKGAPF